MTIYSHFVFISNKSQLKCWRGSYMPMSELSTEHPEAWRDIVEHAAQLLQKERESYRAPSQSTHFSAKQYTRAHRCNPTENNGLT